MRQANFDTVSFELDGNVLPGQKFDADAQCALFHGPGFRQVYLISISFVFKPTKNCTGKTCW